MAYQMQVLIVVVTMTVISVKAYAIKRDIVFSNADATFHRKSHPRNFFLDQPFVDKISLQTSTVIPMRNRTISQQVLRDMSSKDRIVYSSGFSVLRHQPTKQNSFRVTSFEDKPLLKDAIIKNQKMPGERAIFRENSFEEQSLTPAEIFEGQASTYRSKAPFKEQLLMIKTPFKNLFREQLSSTEQALFQKQATFVESPSMSKFYQEDYIKPIDLRVYERYKDILPSSDSKYIKYDNHMPRLPSMPMVLSSEHLLPLNAKISSSTPVIIHRQNPAKILSSVYSDMGEAHSLEASKMELNPMLMSANNYNMLDDSSSTTIPSISVSTNQSSIGHILTSLTTKPSSPVMATSIASAGNIIEPIYFHATKYGAILPSLPALSELNSDMHAYALSYTPKNSLKINEHDCNFPALETPKNVETQSSVLNYILSEEHKNGLKDIQIQNSFTDYALPVKLKHKWPLQQFSQPQSSPETSSGYALLSLNEKAKLILPNIPVAPISWPIEVKNDVSTMLPMKSIITTNAAIRNKLSLDFTTNSLPSSTSNDISGSISDSGILGGMTTDIPASIPTLNLGQSLHHVEQLRQTQEARNPWYPTGLQQFGEFDRINYTLHMDNSVMKPIEHGMAKASLTSPKLSQPHALAFAKVSSQDAIISSMVRDTHDDIVGKIFQWHTQLF